ncbi:hypothetical protein PYCC9005_001699 [Savitreella phatthalungensis]
MRGLPKQQLTVLALCRFSEPIAYTSVNPYLFNMIRDMHISDDPKRIATYGGMLGSVFSLGSFLSGLAWGRASDRFGRKPIVLLGLFGTVVSLLVFGTSLTIYQAIIARFANGLLNGNVGVIRTMVAELVPDKRYQATAFSIMPIVWSAGSILGPTIGGLLADPVHSMPKAFSHSRLFTKFPYLLPNLVAAVGLAISMICGWLFIRETLGPRVYDRDAGREVAAWIGRTCCSSCGGGKRRPGHSNRIHGHRREFSALSTDSEMEHGLLASGRPSTSGTAAAALSTMDEPVTKDAASTPLPPPALRELLTPQVTLNVTTYAIMCFHTITFDSIFPLFIATSVADGGLGLDPATIGMCMSVVGASTMLCQIVVYPPTQRRFGSAWCMRVFSLLNAVVYLLVPLLPHLAGRERWQILLGVCLVSALKFSVGTFLYPSSAILVTNSVPTKRLLGSVNGLNQASGSFARMLGPTLFGILLTYALESHRPQLCWWTLSLMSICTFILSCFLVEDVYPEVTTSSSSQDQMSDSDDDDDGVLTPPHPHTRIAIPADLPSPRLPRT